MRKPRLSYPTHNFARQVREKDNVQKLTMILDEGTIGALIDGMLK